jgi:flagellar motor component MotA
MNPFSFHLEFFSKQMHDLRDICVSFRGKFQVAEIISDTETIHSLYKYMRKFRAMGIQEIERRIFILSLLYIISFVNFSSFQME